MKTNQNHSPESLNSEKLDEMPDYETLNRVVAKGISVFPPTILNKNPSGQLLNLKQQR